MYQLLAKKGQLFAIILGVAVVAIFLITVFTGLGSEGYTVGDDLNQIMKNNPDQKFSFFDPGLYLTVALVALGFAAALLFGLFQLFSSPKQSLKGIIGVAVIAAMFFAFYSSAGVDAADTPMANLLDKFDVSDNVSKLITGGIMTTLILIGVSFVSMILLEVYNLFK